MRLLPQPPDAVNRKKPPDHLLHQLSFPSLPGDPRSDPEEGLEGTWWRKGPSGDSSLILLYTRAVKVC